MEGVQPAQLSLLAIYNPSLGETEETLHDQVVYYHTSKSKGPRGVSADDRKQQDRNEDNDKLRQIGLAQGMVEFAKAFSNGASVDAVDAEKSRTILHEVEPGWWVLATVDLTRIQSIPSKSKKVSSNEPTVEYSTREVCSQDLLLKHLLRAHAIFLLHQAPSLSDLYVRLTREKFCSSLERFWNRFARDWEVLMHDSPAVDIFNGLKLAAGGELGIGVGEEEWGSGEREVLEGLVERTDGLVDLVVSRFGGAEDSLIDTTKEQNTEVPWLGSGSSPSSADGVIFSGMGAVTRPCLRTLSAWMEWIYKYGVNSYGVQDNPNSGRRRRKRRQLSARVVEDTVSHVPRPTLDTATSAKRSSETTISKRERSPGIPPPIVKAVIKSSASHENEEYVSDSVSNAETLVKYMTLGVYGSSWGIRSGRPSIHRQGSDHTDFAPSAKPEENKKLRQLEPKAYGVGDGQDITNGCFLIGLQGDLEREDTDEDKDHTTGGDTGTDQEPGKVKTWNRRIMLRTLWIERMRSQSEISASRDYDEPLSPTYFDRLRVIVYVCRPFMFTFLFSTATPSLTFTSLYRALHSQLSPLIRPLSTSTSPINVLTRLQEALTFPRTSTLSSGMDSTNPIFDLVFDPDSMTVHTTLPGVPDFGEGVVGTGGGGDWSRIDALNVHGQILALIAATRGDPREIERTVKTSRGWWVVWMRLGPDRVAGDDDDADGQNAPPQRVAAVASGRGKGGYREAFLVRKASDHQDKGQGRRTGWVGGGSGGSGREGKWGEAGKVVEGIGVDARRYVEGLLSLSR